MRLTSLGRGVLVAAITLVTVGLVAGVPAVTLLGATGLVAVLVAAVTVVEPPPADVARRADQPSVERGETTSVTLVFRATTSKRPRPFTIVEHVAGEPRAATIPATSAREPYVVNYPLVTEQRGEVVCGPLLLRRSDPFGLIVADRQLSDTCTVMVRPRRHALPFLPSGLLRDLEGPTREVSAGSSSFHQLREYVPGDDVRHVHWRTTARTGDLVVKHLVDTTRPELLVVLDNRAKVLRPSAFEEAVDVCASVVHAAELSGFPVRLVVSDGSPGIDADGHPIDHLDRLTSVQLGDHSSLDQLADGLRGRGRSLVFITGEPSGQDLALVGRLARQFRPAILVSVAPDRSMPLVAPSGVRAVACTSAASFVTSWRGAA
jgi:uncharacterized protein (DUF58 family)